MRPAAGQPGVAMTGRKYRRTAEGPNPRDGSLYPSMAAPGEGVWVPFSLGRTAYLERQNGSSFSAGYTAGAVAIVLQCRPDLTAPQIEELFRMTALDLGAPGPDQTFGYGLIDLSRALERLGPCATP